jgi:hypothetical protein
MESVISTSAARLRVRRIMEDSNEGVLLSDATHRAGA